LLSQVICGECDKKCVIDIYKEGGKLVFEGHNCDKGIDYGEAYMKSSKRIFTTVVRVKGNTSLKVVPVKSNKPIDVSLWIQCSKALGRLYVGVPVKIGDVICKNILNTGVDIICTKNVERES
jgi:CxxC motif-containing protein